MFAFSLTLLRLFRVLRSCWRDPEFRTLLVLFMAILAAATGFYSRVEGWTVLDSLYFSVVTVATVGYGDFTPHTAAGKIFTIVYLVVGVGLFVALAGKLAVGVFQGPLTELDREPAGDGNASPDRPTGEV